MGGLTELSVLGPLAVFGGPVSGLPKGQGCRAAEGEGAVWGGGCADRAGVAGKWAGGRSLVGAVADGC